MNTFIYKSGFHSNFQPGVKGNDNWAEKNMMEKGIKRKEMSALWKFIRLD